MPQRTGTRDHAEASSPLREEILGPPRPSGRAVFCLIAFGLLLAVTLAIDGFTDGPSMAGTALVAAGMMLLLGVAELLDPTARRLVIGVRLGGTVMGLLGLVVQIAG